MGQNDSATPPSPRTQVRRLAQRGHYDRATINAILDEAFICHVACRHDGFVGVIPTAYVRCDDHLVLHGSVGNRILRALRDGAEASVCVTLVDGLVLARSAFHHSLNYRSVVLFAAATEVTDEEEKLGAMHRFIEHVFPGRWPEIRWPTPDELVKTLVLRLPITEASAKVRSGPPIDDEEDLSLPCWAGVIPLQLNASAPVAAPELAKETPVPEYVRRYHQRRDA